MTLFLLGSSVATLILLPLGESDPPAPVKARYAGQVTGIRMTLTVVIPDTQEKIGAYSLTLGAAAHLTKCL